ncbi:MAG: hypothetical protein LBQ50_01980 [Planctomycetaceae bacterium]|jgi:hypothetical protein|nr:hypothetical protein [Planctomycetaceae bacterium]
MMVLLAAHQDTQSRTEISSYHTTYNTFNKIRFLIDQSQRLGFLLHGDSPCHAEWELLEKIHDSVQTEQGQFISLNIQDFGEATLPGVFLSALEYSQSERIFRINLPIILQNNPKTDSPFINRAILWQRLCDRILEDETRQRPTVLVLENIDCATRKTQHDAIRLIRFHANHRIPRTFLLTLHRDHVSFLEPELHDLVEESIEIDT